MREKKVLQYLANFMDLHQLFPRSGRAVVAVSGGVDSLLLAFLLSRPLLRAKFMTLSGIHINHGTRPECAQEEQAVWSQLQEWSMDCQMAHPQLSLASSNFEHQARQARYEIFARSVVGPEDCLYLGHQIDDSFEWYCMQQWKSAGGHALGIPVRRGIFARPLMCFTKAQILYLAHRFDLHYHEDLSNQEERFERNFLRRQIVPRIKKAYPHYLRHYVFRANQWAYQLGYQRRFPPSFLQRRLSGGGIFLIHPQLKNDFQGAETLITNLIWELSGKQRGQLAREITKLIRAQMRGQHGPHHFTGGVQVAMGAGYLFFYQRENQYLPQEVIFECPKDSQIPDVETFFSRPALFIKSAINLNIWEKFQIRYHPLLPPKGEYYFYDLFKIYRSKVIPKSRDKRLN